MTNSNKGLPAVGLTAYGKPLAYSTRRLARWCNGSTADSGSVCHGSNPCRAANFSFATSQDFIRLRVVYALVKIVVAHHHGRHAAAGQALDEFDRELSVLRRLRAVTVRIEPQLLAKMFVQLMRPAQRA